MNYFNNNGLELSVKDRRKPRDKFWDFKKENKIERSSYIEIITIIISIKNFVDNIFVQHLRG